MAEAGSMVAPSLGIPQGVAGLQAESPPADRTRRFRIDVCLAEGIAIDSQTVADLKAVGVILEAR